MSSLPCDVTVALIIGSVGYFVACLVHKQLVGVQAMTAVTEKPKRKYPKRSEDDVKLETLETLTHNANYEIATAAVKMVVKRVAQGRDYELLLRHIMGDNEVKRNTALESLCFLHQKDFVSIVKPNLSIYMAIMTCLCKPKMQAEATDFETKVAAGNPAPRSLHYDNALCLLSQIMLDVSEGIPENVEGELELYARRDYAIRKALRAGLVRVWLTAYPWHGQRENRTGAQSVLLDRINSLYPDSRMSEILRAIWEDKMQRLDDIDAGCVQFYDLVDKLSGLSQRSKTNMFLCSRQSLLTDWPNIESRSMSVNYRLPQDDAEDRRLRRRRREAVVIEDQGQPVRASNIYQRELTEEEDVAVTDEDTGSEAPEVHDPPSPDVSVTPRRFTMEEDLPPAEIDRILERFRIQRAANLF